MSNAVKSKSWGKNFDVAYTHTGSPPVIEHYVVNTGATIVRGTPVALSSGKIVAATALSGAILGIAIAPGVGGDVIPVAIGDRVNIFIGQADDALSSATFPLVCDIVVSNSLFLVDVGSTSKKVVRVIGPVPGDDLTGTGAAAPRVFFQIERSEYDGINPAIS